MNEYTVRWYIDIQEDSPELAAREALRIMRDPLSIATVFDVDWLEKHACTLDGCEIAVDRHRVEIDLGLQKTP